DGRAKLRLRHYFEHSADLMVGSEGGPPRWFSPLDVGPSSEQAPVMLYLPGPIGDGLGLMLHHHRFGKIFNMWCLHIPLQDRTSFTDLVKLVENVVVTEHCRAPRRPIYLFAESFGGCLALAVASRNPSIDLVLILANPATSFSSFLVPKQPFIVQGKVPSSLLFAISLLSGLSCVPLKMLGSNILKLLPLEHILGEMFQDSAALSRYLSAIGDVLTVETVIWKLNLLQSAASYANSRLHAVKAQALILASGKDQLLPSREEAERLHKLLPKCEVRVFEDADHALFLNEDIDLVPTITGASFYRRGGRHDYVFDYLPPTPSEFEKIYNDVRWFEAFTGPVMLSTLESGEVVRNLSGIPSEGPVLYVGYHMMMGLELIPLVTLFLKERNVLLRGIAHPMVFMKKKEGRLPSISSFDIFRTFGAVPVSATNFYKLFSSKSHVLLYPGGVREALHRKGEEYKLFWPEQSEFVRMAAKFGAKIIPFGAVGEDDVLQLLVDYDEQMKVPSFKNFIQEITDEAIKLRNDAGGEVGNQDLYMPVVAPRLPGRFYYYFGKPIETQGWRGEELKRRENADELYLQVKGEVEKCLQFLKEKRENDPYRNIFARLAYQTVNGFDSEVPTFEL
ncbi:hypothetical protein M569_02985, partial [Genlisea aurea]